MSTALFALYEAVDKVICDKELFNHYKEQASLRGKFFSKEITTKAVEEMLESL